MPGFTLTLREPDLKSVPGYELPGISTAAKATPPGWTKFICNGSVVTEAICVSLVFWSCVVAGLQL